MKLLKSVFDFYINSSIHVAIAVCCFTAVSLMRFEYCPDTQFLAFIFFGTVTGYNFVKYAGVAKLHHRSLARNLKLIQLFSFLSFLALIYFLLQLPLRTLFWAGLFGLLTLFYAVPVLPAKKNLRSFKGLKIFIITLVVAGVTVILPVIHQGYTPGMEEIVVFFQRCLFIIAAMIPFEIRDLKYDPQALGTIPQELGIRRTKAGGMVLLVLFVIPDLFNTSQRESFLYASIAISVITAIFIFFSKTDQPKYYSSFWVEALPIFWVIIALLITASIY